MIDVLIAGRLHEAPEKRVDRNGHPYAVATVRTTASNRAVVYISVVAFDDAPVAALLAMSDGDSIAVCGELTPKAWIDKTGTARPCLDLVAQQVLTEVHLARKRKALEAAT